MEEVEEEEDEEELDDADGAGLVLCTTDLFGEEMATGTSGNTGIETGVFFPQNFIQNISLPVKQLLGVRQFHLWLRGQKTIARYL